MSLSLHKVSYYIFVHSFHYSLLYIKFLIYCLHEVSYVLFCILIFYAVEGVFVSPMCTQIHTQYLSLTLLHQNQIPGVL